MPGSGHLLLRRKAGVYILGGFTLLVVTLVIFLTRASGATLLEYVLSTRTLRVLIVACSVVAVAWVAVVLRTYRLARPPRLAPNAQAIGGLMVLVLCLMVTAPFAFGAYVANSQQSLLDALFPAGSENSPNLIDKPRINILLVGSDAAKGREGTRTDSVLVASIDTRGGRTTLFSLPRNLEYAQFPPGSPAAEEFPKGFHDPSNPNSSDYLLNAVYGYGHANPELARGGMDGDNPGLNLLSSSVGYMLGLDMDYYIEVNMQGFAALIDALGGVEVDVGPNRIPMGGIGAEQYRPYGYIQPGNQRLNGDQALWYARSRSNASDYVRMGRQRCLLQYLLDQKSPLDVIKNFQGVAAASTASLDTNIPQSLLPGLAALPGNDNSRPLESVSFDPALPDPSTSSGRFNPGRPNFDYMRDVVRAAIDPSTASALPSPPPRASESPPSSSDPPESRTAAPTSLEDTCAAAGTP